MYHPAWEWWQACSVCPTIWLCSDGDLCPSNLANPPVPNLGHLETAVVQPKLLVTNFAAYRDRTFAKLLQYTGDFAAKNTPDCLDSLLSDSRGVVLDVGPGAGHQLFRFSNPTNIKAIYGVEPGVTMHGDLRERAVRAGLGDKYKILSCGAEEESLYPALAKEGLLSDAVNQARADTGGAVFDEIVCVRVLCGVPLPESTIQGLYSLLKPGGRFIVCEHVVNSGDARAGGSSLGLMLQNVFMLVGWAFWTGGCQLKRDTLKLLMKAAEQDDGWDKVDIETWEAWSTVPHIVGALTKKA